MENVRENPVSIRMVMTFTDGKSGLHLDAIQIVVCRVLYYRKMKTNLQQITYLLLLLAILTISRTQQAQIPTTTTNLDEDVMVLESKQGSAVNDCPRHICKCLGNYVECTKKGLTQITFNIPNWTDELDLSKNQLDDSVVEELSELPKLTKLILKKNALTQIPEFVQIPNLVRLNLMSNSISKWQPTALAGMTQLKQLFLTKNRLTALQYDMFPENNTLKTLVLSSNLIKSLEPGVFKNLQQLIRLDLDNNEIKSIPGLAFEHLANLSILRLRENNITDLYDGAFHGLSQIEILDLDSNKIKKIRKAGLFNLSSLNVFSLSRNMIDSIEPDGWEYCRNLTKLDLSYNKLERIDRHMFSGLHSLQFLDLRANSIDTVAEHAFQSLTNLEALYLSENKISWIVEDMNGPFLGLANLKVLDLSSNYIKSINKNAFVGLISLAELNLNENEISSIENNVFMSLRALKTLSFNSNKLLCDCNMTWFFLWLNETKMKINATCGFPASKKGVNMSAISFSNSECDQSPKPVLIDEPKSQLAIKYTNVTLKCTASATSNAQMSFKWKHDNVELTGERLTTRISNSKNSVELYDSDYENNEITTETAMTSSESQKFNTTILTSILILRNVTQERTAGKYQCIVSNNYGTTYSDKSRIAVVTVPKFRKQPQDIVVQAGETARLDCAAEGDPKPQIYWEKDGGNDFTAAREKRMRVMPEDDAFFITNVKVSDMGMYACTAESLGGMIKANATLVVYESPSFVRPMENKEVISGKSSVLECLASGYPKPKLQWLKDNRPIEAAGRHFFAADQQLLIIVDTAMSDAGVYKCTMTNDLGTKFDYMKLTVVPVASSLGLGYDFLGIIVIIIVACCVGTSIIWVVIIYQTRRRSAVERHYEPSNLLNIVPAMPTSKFHADHSSGSMPDYTAVDDGDSFSNDHSNLEGMLSSQQDSVPTTDRIDDVDGVIVSKIGIVKNDDHFYVDMSGRPPTTTTTNTSLCTNDGGTFGSKEKISYENNSTLTANTPQNSDEEPTTPKLVNGDDDQQLGSEKNDQLEPLLNSGTDGSTPVIVQMHKKPPYPLPLTVSISEKGAIMSSTAPATSPLPLK